MVEGHQQPVPAVEAALGNHRKMTALITKKKALAGRRKRWRHCSFGWERPTRTSKASRIQKMLSVVRLDCPPIVMGEVVVVAFLARERCKVAGGLVLQQAVVVAGAFTSVEGGGSLEIWS